jgi:predicted nucleotidyltransferase component of viral defense system
LKIKKIIFTFKDYEENNNELNTYTLESIAVDKILRITDVDKEVRDIYDLWYLLKLNLNIDKINEQFKKRIGYNPIFQDLINIINSPIYKQTWKLRLEKQVLKLPTYETVIKELGDLIKNKLFPVEDRPL